MESSGFHHSNRYDGFQWYVMDILSLKCCTFFPNDNALNRCFFAILI